MDCSYLFIMDNLFSLSNGETGINYIIKSIEGSNKIKRRLLDLGFVNTSVKILKRSTLRGVFLLEIRHFVLALKRKEVEKIMVAK